MSGFAHRIVPPTSEPTETAGFLTPVCLQVSAVAYGVRDSYETQPRRGFRSDPCRRNASAHGGGVRRHPALRGARKRSCSARRTVLRSSRRGYAAGKGAWQALAFRRPDCGVVCSLEAPGASFEGLIFMPKRTDRTPSASFSSRAAEGRSSGTLGEPKENS
jgi:hypothetical protein